MDMYVDLECPMHKYVPSDDQQHTFPDPPGKVLGLVNFVYGVVVVSYIPIYGEEPAAAAKRVPLGFHAMP